MCFEKQRGDFGVSAHVTSTVQKSTTSYSIHVYAFDACTVVGLVHVSSVGCARFRRAFADGRAGERPFALCLSRC